MVCIIYALYIAFLVFIKFMAYASPSGEKDWLPAMRKAIQELTVGKEFAAQVERRLREHQEDTEIIALMDVVTGSISQALSSLDPYSDDQMKYEIPGGKRKTCSLSGYKRGVYQKRIPPSPSRQVKSNTISDGYIWRKYGQKDIQSTMHPRSYYRCLHKVSQGCQATRHVQRSEDDPSLFLITYLGEHTCKEPTAPQHLLTFSSLEEESLISFGSRAYNITQDVPPMSSSFPSQEVLSNLTTPGSLYSDNTNMPNLGTYGDVDLGPHEGSRHGGATVGCVSNQGDVTPGLQSSLSSLDMSLLIDSFDCLDEVFSFDEGEFPYFKDGEGAPFF